MKNFFRKVNIRHIDNHKVTELQIVIVRGAVQSDKGKIRVIMNQYAHNLRQIRMHSNVQLEWYYNNTIDRSTILKDGFQRIKSNDGYTIPLIIKQWLPLLLIRSYTNNNWENLPCVIFTSDDE